jgi:hypothetical protein
MSHLPDYWISSHLETHNGENHEAVRNPCPRGSPHNGRNLSARRFQFTR